MKATQLLIGAGTVAGATLMASTAFADCAITTESGKRRVTHIQASGAAKACGIQTALFARRVGEDATATMHCNGSKCEVKDATFSYDFNKNVVTVIAEGQKSSFSARNYTASIDGRSTKGTKVQTNTEVGGVNTGSFETKKTYVAKPQECDIWKGLKFEGRAPACKP